MAVSISYAAFTQNLNINGTANVTASNWSVRFANLTNAEGKTGNYSSPYPKVYDNNAVNIYPVVESYTNKIASEYK